MNAQYIGKEANKDGSFKYLFNVDGKEIGITEGGENGGAYEDRDGNDAATNFNLFLVFEITDEMRADVVSSEAAQSTRDELFAEMKAIHAEIMDKYESGLPAGELRQKYDSLERQFLDLNECNY